MDPTTQNILRKCADRLIQTADLIARSSPSASTTTASTAAPAIAASTSTTASSFQSNSAPSAVSTARAEHARLFGYQPGGVFKKCRRASRLLQFARKRLFSLYSLALTRMSFRDFPLRYDSRGGSLKIFLSCGWFCIKCHFPMSIFFKLGKAGWYCVTKGRIFFCAVLFRSICQRRFPFREFDFSTVAVGYPLLSRRVAKLLMFSSKVVCEEFVLRSLKASPLMKPFVTPGG